MSTQVAEKRTTLPPELKEAGWKLQRKIINDDEENVVFVAANEALKLSTGGYSEIDEAIDVAEFLQKRQQGMKAKRPDAEVVPAQAALSIEEEEALAIQEEANSSTIVAPVAETESSEASADENAAPDSEEYQQPPAGSSYTIDDGASQVTHPAQTPVEPPTGPKYLDLAVIRTDGGTQPRSALNMLTVDEYKEAMTHGAEFPPVKVFFDGMNYWLADGFHRLAARKAGAFSGVKADIENGTHRDALLYSLGANATHGLARSNDDKRRAVTVMLEDPEWTKWSDSAIAEKLSVSQPFIGKIRKELITQNVISEQTERVGKDGVVRDTSNIGKPQQEDLRQVTIADIEGAITNATPEGQEQMNLAIADTQVDNETQAVEDNTEQVDKEEVTSAVSDTAEIVAALNRHGGFMYRMGLEEIGFSYEAILRAVADGAIIQPETGKFTLPDHKPQPSAPSEPPAADSTQETTATPSSPSPKPKHSVDELLNGRQLSISFVWAPGLKGKVIVSVNTSNKPENATKKVVDAEGVRGFSGEVMDMIVAQLEGKAAPQQKKKEAPKAKPAAKKAKSTKKAPVKKKVPAKKPVSKKKPAAKGRKR